MLHNGIADWISISNENAISYKKVVLDKHINHKTIHQTIYETKMVVTDSIKDPFMHLTCRFSRPASKIEEGFVPWKK